MIGRTLGHYQIAGKLGEGGMGEVFRATDTKLGRDVALKVLPADMARDPERLARFQREARAVAALNHPHIVTIYSVEHRDDVHFLTMELIDGASLADAIPGGGAPVDRIVSTGVALADALAAAHEKGIIHRDLKPANVMVTKDGRLKVLDFGLAKEMRATEPADATLTAAGHTQIGLVMGTPAYMSPEQIAARTVDHRTDIFSLGVLLYQMASGLRPFDGPTAIELASSILRDTPRPIEEIRSDVPPDLARLIYRCLEKDPQRRVQTMGDVCDALHGVAHAPGVERAERVEEEEGFWIAVLPFRYGGSNADVAALAEGLSEEIVTGLSRFSYLRVIARGTSEKTARYTLEGSVRQAGATIRVAAQLLDTIACAHLWAETYERRFDAERIFALQDDLIARIVATCADTFGVLPRSICDAVRGKPSSRLSPYEALMRGFGYYQRATPAEHAEARDALERAVGQAPDNADCLAALSGIYAAEFGHGFNPRPGTLDRALTAARRAVHIAPANALAHQALAMALFFLKDVPGCLGAAERAIALNPLDTSNVMHAIAFTGDWERGCALIRRAMDLNPHHPAWYGNVLALDEYRRVNYRAAVDLAVKANVPGVFWTNIVLAAAHAQLDESDAARTALDALLAQKPDFRESAPTLMATWFEPAFGEHLLAGLRKAGLDAA